ETSRSWIRSVTRGPGLRGGRAVRVIVGGRTSGGAFRGAQPCRGDPATQGIARRRTLQLVPRVAGVTATGLGPPEGRPSAAPPPATAHPGPAPGSSRGCRSIRFPRRRRRRAARLRRLPVPLAADEVGQVRPIGALADVQVAAPDR